MSLIQNEIPEFRWLGEHGDYAWEAPDDIVSQWLAFSNRESTGNTLDIFDVIGDDIFGDGVSDKDVGDYLAGREGREVNVRINSPGGDVFAGLSIYNLLRNHNAKVTVQVTGMAASAASIIAMAADEIIMGEGSMMMIHNAWGLSVGNKHDMMSAYRLLDKIDMQLNGIYAARTGSKETDIAAMMDDETFMTHTEAVDNNFADTIDSAMKVSNHAGKKPTDKTPLMEKRTLERALGRIGVPRNKRDACISLILDGTPRDASANTPAPRDAGDTSEAMRMLHDLKSIFAT